MKDNLRLSRLAYPRATLIILSSAYRCWSCRWASALTRKCNRSLRPGSSTAPVCWRNLSRHSANIYRQREDRGKTIQTIAQAPAPGPQPRLVIWGLRRLGKLLPHRSRNSTRSGCGEWFIYDQADHRNLHRWVADAQQSLQRSRGYRPYEID